MYRIRLERLELGVVLVQLQVIVRSTLQIFNKLFTLLTTATLWYSNSLASFPGPAQLPSLAARKGWTGPGDDSHPMRTGSGTSETFLICTHVICNVISEVAWAIVRNSQRGRRKGGRGGSFPPLLKAGGLSPSSFSHLRMSPS